MQRVKNIGDEALFVLPCVRGGTGSSLWVFRQMHCWMPEVCFLLRPHYDLCGLCGGPGFDKHDNGIMISMILILPNSFYMKETDSTIGGEHR